jgi:Tfp pilus assembly protein PilE
MGQSSGSSFARCLGFSVAEVTIILTSLSILTAAAAPAVDDYVKQAKLVKAHHDVSTLSVTLIRLLSDTAAEANIPNGWATYEVLVAQVPFHAQQARTRRRGPRNWASRLDCSTTS